MSPSPTLPPPPTPARTLPLAASPPRRSLLSGTVGALGALGLTAGCGGSGDTKNPEQTAAAHRLRATAAQRCRALLARYDATLAAHGTLAGRLAPLRAAVAQHVETFGGGRHRQDGDAHRPQVPGEVPQALTALAGAERRTADAHTSALVQAPPELARTLASAAAAGAAHSYLLGRPDGGQSGGDQSGGDQSAGGAG